MKLLSKTTIDRSFFTGRLSDGSDRVRTTATGFVVQVIDDDGRQRSVEFNHDPTAQEIVTALGRATDLVPTAKADLAVYLDGLYRTWKRWQDTRIEAVARTMPAAVITALTAQENSAWTDYANALNAWRLAS